MKKYPTCKTCGEKMNIYDGNAWYTCPNCEQSVRDNGNGTWTWYDEIFCRPTKELNSDFELADFCRGGELSED